MCRLHAKRMFHLCLTVEIIYIGFLICIVNHYVFCVDNITYDIEGDRVDKNFTAGTDYIETTRTEVLKLVFFISSKCATWNVKFG